MLSKNLKKKFKKKKIIHIILQRPGSIVKFSTVKFSS